MIYAEYWSRSMQHQKVANGKLLGSAIDIKPRYYMTMAA